MGPRLDSVWRANAKWSLSRHEADNGTAQHGSSPDVVSCDVVIVCIGAGDAHPEPGSV